MSTFTTAAFTSGEHGEPLKILALRKPSVEQPPCAEAESPSELPPPPPHPEIASVHNTFKTNNNRRAFRIDSFQIDRIVTPWAEDASDSKITLCSSFIRRDSRDVISFYWQQLI